MESITWESVLETVHGFQSNMYHLTALVRVVKSTAPLFPVALSGPAFQRVQRSQAVAVMASVDYALSSSTVCGAAIASFAAEFKWTRVLPPALAVGANTSIDIGGVAIDASLVAAEAVAAQTWQAALSISALALRPGLVYGVCRVVGLFSLPVSVWLLFFK